MPDNTLESLAQQVAAYQSGYKPNPQQGIDDFAKVFGLGANIHEIIQNSAKRALEMKAQQIKNQEEQTKLTPYKDVAFPLTPSNSTINENTTSEQRAAMDQLYAKREEIGNATLGQAKTQAEIAALNTKANAQADMLPISALPEEAKQRAIAAGFDPSGMINLHKFNAFKTTDPSAMVPAIAGEEAIKAGKVQGNAKIISPMQTGVGSYANIRQTQNILAALPSRASQGTLPAQASGVQLAARQLKALIATPGSYQRLGLAKGDLARMVLRAAPQQEVLKDAGFSDTFINHLNVLKQKISSDPTAIDQPLIRKELYDIGTELERSSRPVLERSLNEVERSYAGSLPQDWQKTRAEELGENFPDIPFQVGIEQQGSPKAGDIENGYRFKGGDPASQNNWEKVQ